MKLYYFSKPKLQYIEIKNFRLKLISSFIVSVLLISSMIFGVYHFIDQIANPAKDLSRLKKENDVLKSSLVEMKELYEILNNNLDSLINFNEDLRVAANLNPVSDEEREVGVGGGYFNNSIDYLSSNIDDELESVISYVDEVQRRINFEKAQYKEIAEKIEDNQNLYSSLPAIKPCSGSLAAHGFGMRNHPILKIKRMHEGIDIITGTGTSVFAAGDGEVSFTGYNGGYGLCVEIDHGFGYTTLYAHLSEIEVKKGTRLKRGDLIAKTGNTGLSTGPHLHYEISHNGIKQNPANFFFDDYEFF
jgi:murein DD-endopeptidase MepM/ murein hydrolase activator NlpD